MHLLAALILSLLLTGNVYANSQSKPLIFGILPFSKPRILLKRFEPLQSLLAQKLGQNISVKTDIDFLTFKGNTKNGLYNIVLTAPHFVPAAVNSGHYILLTTTTNPLSATVIMNSAGSLEQLMQMESPRVATPPVNAFISLIGKQHIAELGLNNTKFKDYSSHNNAYHAVLRNRADAAIIAVNVYNRAIGQNRPIKRVSESPKYPGMVILVRKDMPADQQGLIKDILVSLGETNKGRTILKKISYPGFKPAYPETFLPLENILDVRNDHGREEELQ